MKLKQAVTDGRVSCVSVDDEREVKLTEPREYHDRAGEAFYLSRVSHDAIGIANESNPGQDGRRSHQDSDNTSVDT
jgi:hypothetical protein